MRLPFLRSKPALTPTRAERARPAAAADESTLVEAARTHARRRLVGALVLLIVGVVGFPIVFETQPRPLSVDTPIIASSARTTAAVPAPSLPRTPPAGVQPLSEVEAVDPPASAQPSRTTAPAPAVPPLLPVITERATLPASAAPSVNAAASTATGSASAPGGRFVVQIGAYSDAATLRETRVKVEKLGLKTYTQLVNSDAGPRTRVRLGPYATRDEADAAAARLKRAGLPANILAL